MTPSDVNNAARDLYNATGDSFFSDTQIYNWMTQACNEIAREAFLIEATSSSTTTAALQTYAYPTNFIAVKRVTVNGKKLKRITGREDDAITLSNQQVTTSGWPIYYTDFNFTLSLRPIPDAVYTMIVSGYQLCPVLTAAATIPIPQVFHFDLVDYLLFRMYGKDKDAVMAKMHYDLWTSHLTRARAYKARLKRTDSFATVQSEENLPVTILGEA